jgi:hypothetical protein
MAKKPASKKTGSIGRQGAVAAFSPRELASPVAAVAQLSNIIMDDSYARRAAQAYTDPDTVQVVMAVDEAEVGEAVPPERFFVRLRFTLKIVQKGAEDPKEPLVDMMARFVILYDLPKDNSISAESLTAFAGSSGVFSVWPYWREFVHSTSLRLAVPPIILPTYRI